MLKEEDKETLEGFCNIFQRGEQSEVLLFSKEMAEYQNLSKRAILIIMANLMQDEHKRERFFSFLESTCFADSCL